MRFFLVLFLPLSLLFAEPIKKAVFNCKSGEHSSFLKTLDSMNHLVSNYEKMGVSHSVVLIAQSECVKFMLQDTTGTQYQKEDMPLDIDLKMQKLEGKARFEQCAVTLERKEIPQKKLKKQVAVIPSATLSVVDYQLSGYALVP